MRSKVLISPIEGIPYSISGQFCPLLNFRLKSHKCEAAKHIPVVQSLRAGAVEHQGLQGFSKLVVNPIDIMILVARYVSPLRKNLQMFR